MATIQLGVINDIGIIRIAPFTAVELKCLASAVNADNSAALADAATESANAAAATALSYVGTSPTGAYANLAALQAAYPTGEDGVFVVKDTGYWYFWNGSAWEDGGEYQKDIPTTTIEELRMSDLRQMSAIKEVENTLNSININQETTNTASGYGTISLPKNAANGGMGVKLEGLTAENLVVNGDFRNGLDGWTGYSTVTLSLEGDYLVYTSNSVTQAFSQGNKSFNAGDKFYFYIVMKIQTTPVNLTFGFAKSGIGTNLAPTTLVGTSDTIMKAILTTTNATINDLVLGRNVTIGEKAYLKKGSRVINLTATFGAGNEPDLATCDAMFSDYFEGVKSFVPTGRVRSVDKNGLNPTALYLTAPELRSNGAVKDEIRKGSNGYELVKRVGVGTLGSELIINRTFDTADGWTIVGESNIVDGAARVYSSSGDLSYIKTTAVVMQDTLFYKLKLDVTNYVSGDLVHTLGGGSDILNINSAGAYSKYIKADVYTQLHLKRLSTSGITDITIDNVSLRQVIPQDGAISDTSTFTELSDGTILYTLATPVISPISYGGVLNSAENGTVYHEPVVADAGVYGTNLPIFSHDYPISGIEEIIKHEDGVDTYLNASTTVIAPDGLSFTHPDLTEGDLVLFTYSFDKESTNGQLTATFYDSNVVKIDTVTGKAYKITDVVTNGVLTRTLTEV